MTYSNLTHYVRTGDFVVSLSVMPKMPMSLPFHRRALPLHWRYRRSPGATTSPYPSSFQNSVQIRPSVNYAQAATSTYKSSSPSTSMRSHITVLPLSNIYATSGSGSGSAARVAYYQTYGITEDFTGTHKHRFNVSGYRFAVRSFIPRIAYAVTLLHRNHEPAEANSPERLRWTRNSPRWQQKTTGRPTAESRNWNYTLAGILFIALKIAL